MPLSNPGRIYLDGAWYNTEGLSEHAPLRTFSSMADSLTGALVVTQVQVTRNRRTYTLVVERSELATLRASVAKTGALNLIDHEGFGWWTAAGTDDDNNAYETGAYFSPGFELTPKPTQPNGFVKDNVWTVDVPLVMNANGKSKA